MTEHKPEWDEAFGAALVGALVVVGITRESPSGTTQEQCFGIVDKADAEGIELALGGSRTGERFFLPPDPHAFVAAAPGSYRLRSTEETVEDPAYTATWTVAAANNGRR